MHSLKPHPVHRILCSLGAVALMVTSAHGEQAKDRSWDEARIRASHIQHHSPADLPEGPVFEADPRSLSVVVHQGANRATVLGDDPLHALHRLETRPAVRGAPKFSPDGRFAYLASRDGWVAKFDLYSLKRVAEIRVGTRTHNIAVSGDGATVMAANRDPHTLVALDADDLSLLKVIPARSKGGADSRVGPVYTAPPRKTFIAALKDTPEIWEISYRQDPPAGFGGWVHDYREKSGDADTSQRFPVRRIEQDTPFGRFFFDRDYTLAFLASGERDEVRMVDLDTNHCLATLRMPGLPPGASRITWNHEDRPLLATPSLGEGAVTVVDMESFETLKRIGTLGPGDFIRSHSGSRYAWIDISAARHADKIQILDKQRLEIVETLRPVPGKPASRVVFSRDGRYAVVSVGTKGQKFVIYDARTLDKVQKITVSNSRIKRGSLD